MALDKFLKEARECAKNEQKWCDEHLELADYVEKLCLMLEKCEGQRNIWARSYIGYLATLDQATDLSLEEQDKELMAIAGMT